MPEIEWTPEQSTILDTGADRHTLILAGPGTGKSAVVIALANQLAEASGLGTIRLATFTRAATAELAGKAVDGDLHAPVTTVHSFAFRLLRANEQWNRLPLPIRIPDKWELKELLYADIRDRLAAADWDGIRRSKVERLVREMAAKWEALDEDLILEADLDPDLRTAFTSLWQRQRLVFGYSLFAEMPWYAHELVEDHPDADLGHLQTLIVDEYQDLNASELRLIKALADRGIIVVAVGDDEQSIYSWRMAAPQGIRRFTGDYQDAHYHTLTLSRRCGERILQPSQQLIATSPTRMPDRPTLQPADDLPVGEFAYLVFDDAADERRGVIELIERHLSAGTEAARIAVLVRADFHGNWTRDIREILEARDIPVRDIESATEPLSQPDARQALATCRLLLDSRDDLAWWTLLKLRRNCSDEYIRAISNAALDDGFRFHERLMRMAAEPVDGTTVSRNTVLAAIADVETVRSEIGELREFAEPGDALLEIARLMGLELEPGFLELVVATVARLIEGKEEIGLGDLLNQLEPVAKDLALEAGGVALMTIAGSKGLTFDVTIAIGVEEEVFSAETQHEHEEMRRLLYVAMTRATSACYLTMATERSDATAYSFDGNAIYSRSRSTFLSVAGIHPVPGHAYLA